MAPGLHRRPYNLQLDLATSTFNGVCIFSCHVRTTARKKKKKEDEEFQPLSWYWRGLQPYRGNLKARGSSGKGKKLQAVKADSSCTLV